MDKNARCMIILYNLSTIIPTTDKSAEQYDIMSQYLSGMAFESKYNRIKKKGESL